MPLVIVSCFHETEVSRCGITLCGRKSGRVLPNKICRQPGVPLKLYVQSDNAEKNVGLALNNGAPPVDTPAERSQPRVSITLHCLRFERFMPLPAFFSGIVVFTFSPDSCTQAPTPSVHKHRNLALTCEQMVSVCL